MTKHNIWSISIIGILFALLFTPLIVSGTLYFPYVTGKVFAFRLGVSLITIAWIILVLKRPEYMPKKSNVLIASGVFVLLLAISNFFGADRTVSFFSNYERMEGWFTHVYLFLYLVIISSVLNTENLWNWFFKVSLIAANIVALYGLFGSVSRIDAFLGNSTYVAIYVFFNLFFAILLAYRLYISEIKNMSIKYAGMIYYVSSALLLTYIIFRTQTRGTILALMFSIIVFLILSAICYRKNKKIKVVSVSLFALVVMMSGLFWMNRDSQFVTNNPMLSRIASISPTEGTGKARIINWGIALDGIKERPILGWGQENYMYVFSQHYDPDMFREEPWFDRTHNSFIDWAIQGGIFAFILYVSLFVLAGLSVYKSHTLSVTEKNLLASLLGGYAIHNLFVFDNYSSYLMFFSVLGFIVCHSKKDILVLNWSEKTKQATAIVGIALICISSYVVIIRPYVVAGDLIKVLSERDMGKVLDTYENLLAKNTFGNFEATTRLLSDASNFTKNQNPDLVQKYMDLANQAGIQSIIDSPQSVRAYEFYGTFLLQTGNSSQAIEVLEKARAISPNRQNNLYVLGFSYINVKEIDKAVEVFKHAYEVQPENIKAKNYYGGALLLAGDVKGEELVEGYNYNDSFFLSVFNSTKQYKEVIRILEQRVIDQPDNPQFKISLAVSYIFDGQRTKSIEIIREVMKTVPEFQKQGEFLIKEIQAGRNPGL